MFSACVFSSKICHAVALNSGVNIVMIVNNNRNYNFKGTMDNYDFCHNHAALLGPQLYSEHISDTQKQNGHFYSYLINSKL